MQPDRLSTRSRSTPSCRKRLWAGRRPAGTVPSLSRIDGTIRSRSKRILQSAGRDNRRESALRRPHPVWKMARLWETPSPGSWTARSRRLSIAFSRRRAARGLRRVPRKIPARRQLSPRERHRSSGSGSYPDYTTRLPPAPGPQMRGLMAARVTQPTVMS